MFKMPWPPSLRGVLLNDDDSFTTFSRFFYGIISVRLKGQMQVNFLELNSGEPTGEPRVRRRKKNSTYFVYLLLKTSREQISRFNFKFLLAFTVVVTKTLFRFYWGRLGRVEISTLGVGVRVKQTPSNSPFDSPQLLARATDGTKLLND